MALLSKCGGCGDQFTEKHFPQMPHPSTSPREASPSFLSRILHQFDNAVAFPFRTINYPSIVITLPCTHIFHTLCLKGWAKNYTADCPTCREVLLKDQVGKSYSQFVLVFLKILEHEKDKQIIFNALPTSEQSGVVCPVCQDELPTIPITYDQTKQRFFHYACAKNFPHLPLEHLTKVVIEVIKKDPDPEFKAMFVPLHATPIGRFRINHPRLFFLACLELLSLIALVFNRSKYNGQSRTLSVLGYPAYSTLVLTHLVGKAVLFILSSQKD